MLGSGLGLGGLGVLAAVFPQISLPILTAVGGWFARRSLSEIALFIVAGLLVWQHLSLLDAHRQLRSTEQQVVACVKARAADQAHFTTVQQEAAAQNAATVAADKAERERITANVSQSYEDQLSSLRADLARRLRDLAAARQSAASKSDLPDVSPSPSGPDASARVSIPSSLYVRGAELELQLERLQQWIAEQEKVNPNDHR